MAAIVFPLNPTEDQIYTDGDLSWIFKADAWRLLTGAKPPVLVLARYDLAIKPTTGASDLNDSQVFTVDNSTATAKAITFQNAPAGRAMTVVVDVAGSVGAVTFPVTVEFAAGVDTSLSTTRTLLILFWDGSKFIMTANIKK